MCADNNQKIIYSSIQPSGAITLGNYLGALANWVDLQDDFECVFSLADLHTITVRQDPKVFRQNTIEAYALLLACGIDRDKSIFFVQSQVDTHAQLSWILSCFTQFGELSRMTQFKDKSKKYTDNINCGLFSYPVLMAADILLYNAHLVPVGVDQKQHLELARNIAIRFNGIYGQTFRVPEPYINPTCAKIMSLQEPDRKMSKSDSNPSAFISILDDPDDIVKKIKRSVTDSESKVYYSDDKPGISNLLNIYSAVTGTTPDQTQEIFADKGYGDFKNAVADAVIAVLEPIKNRYSQLVKEASYLQDCYHADAEKARVLSHEILNTVMDKLGFVM